MAVGDISIADARYFAFVAEPATGAATHVDVSKALLSCSAKIMFEIIDSDYAFGESGKQSAVSTHYTWMVNVRLRIDAPSDSNAALGGVALVVAAGLRAPGGSAAASSAYKGVGTGRYSVQVSEHGSTAAVGNPVYTGIATINDPSFLYADNETPATERVMSLEFKGAGDLARATK